MKIIVLATAGVAVLASGCASLTDPQATWDSRIDKQKVAQVDSLAKITGTKIYWVNYPQRRPLPSDAAPTVVQPTGT